MCLTKRHQPSSRILAYLFQCSLPPLLSVSSLISFPFPSLFSDFPPFTPSLLLPSHPSLLFPFHPSLLSSFYLFSSFCLLLFPSLFRRALKRAKLLLSMKHGLARLDNVWGMGGGQRPVMFLISKVCWHLIFCCPSPYVCVCMCVCMYVWEGQPNG